MRTRTRLSLAIPAWLAVTASVAWCQPAPLAPRSALRPASPARVIAPRVLRVVDGDTVALKLDGKVYKSRLIGVDTPETVHPTKPVERFGKEASAFLKGLVEGKDVAVEFEGGPSHLDKYGRLLVYLYLDRGAGQPRLFVNREIVARGYEHAYTSYPFRHMEEFRAAERAAREAKLGLWAPEPEPVPEVAVADPTPVAPPAPRAGTTTRAALRPRPAEAPSRDDAVSATVYVTKTGAKYHAEGCRHLARSSIATSLASAAARYAPCSVCDPPTLASAGGGAASAFASPPSPRPSVTSSGGGSSSGTCGAPTKKGTPCRRRVAGGGYCYQHR